MLGGTEEHWMLPLDEEGNADLTGEGIFDNTLGCHVGDFVGLNVVNPIPGFEYQWMLNPNRQGAGMGDALAISRLQGHMVNADDPEYAALKDIEGVEKSFLDTCSTYRELVLVRIPEQVIEEKRRQEHDANLRMISGGPAEDFVSRAGQLEQQLYGNKGPTRFSQSAHQTEFDEGGQTRELHRPDSGIVRNDDNR